MRKRGEAKLFLESLLGRDSAQCIRWPYILNGEGYGYIYIRKKLLHAHRYACQLKHGAPVGYKEAAHECGNRWCVNPNHISWKTKKENAADRLRHGTDHRGDNSPAAKLTWEQVREIRASTERAVELADRFGVVERQIRRIRQGTRWSDKPQSEAA